MTKITRRDLIKTGSIGFASSLCGFNYSAHADAGWGEFPPALSGMPWPSPPTDYRILEVFLYGGVSPWETFFHRPGLSDPWYGLSSEVSALPWACTNSPSPATQTQAFSSSSVASSNIHLGPFTKPLWQSHISNRMRMVVLKHNLEPHEAAIPYSITGHVLGRPNFSSLGAAISHRHKAVDQTLPSSYVFMPNNLGFASDNFQAVDATGAHGGEHRPLKIMIGPGADSFSDQLLRSGISSERDELLNYYRSNYKQKLRWQGGSADADLIRSKGFGAYDAGAGTLLGANELHGLLQTVPLAQQYANECPDGQTTDRQHHTSTALKAAAKLLTTNIADGGARHVCVVDGGVNLYGGAVYDTHSSNSDGTAINLWATLSALAEQIQNPASPDANKINLDNTLIVLKTEFGRTPNVGVNAGGRDHWPTGYVNVLIGGPVIVPASGIKKVVGSIDSGGIALDSNHYTPTDLQAALQVAAGVYPFEAENFGIGDMGPITRAATEEETTLKLWKHILLGDLS